MGILEFISSNIQMIYLVILMIFVGIELISHVPSVLHTPLMSGANAIHGVVIIGAIIVMGQAEGVLSLVLGFIAVIFGTLNVVGGFVVTDRMLEMFKKKNNGAYISSHISYSISHIYVGIKDAFKARHCTQWKSNRSCRYDLAIFATIFYTKIPKEIIWVIWFGFFWHW